MSANLQFRSIILCDQIRREDNGKALLIGVYSGDIVMQSPAPLALFFYIECVGHLDQDEEITFRINVEKSDGTLATDGRAVLKVEDHMDPVLNLGGAYIFQEPGALVLLRETGNEKWSEIFRKKVSISNPSSTEFLSPSGLAQPS